MSADGVPILPDGNWTVVTKDYSWNVTRKFTIPGNTHNISLECEGLKDKGVAGILASGSNGLKTDSNWICGNMETDPGSWSNAYEIGTNGASPWGDLSPGDISGISNEALWIWDSAETWNNAQKQTVTCYRLIGN